MVSMKLLLIILSTCIFFTKQCRKNDSLHCNDLFSHLEQQTPILEKLAEATDPTTDRHGHDGPSQGLVSKHLEKLKLGTKNRLSELRNGMAGRTITGVTDRHRLFREIESLNFVMEAAGQTVAGTMGCHSLRNPRLGQISVK